MIKITELTLETATCINGKWVPARFYQIRSLKQRFIDAYAVFVGKADAVTWEVKR